MAKDDERPENKSAPTVISPFPPKGMRKTEGDVSLAESSHALEEMRSYPGQAPEGEKKTWLERLKDVAILFGFLALAKASPAEETPGGPGVLVEVQAPQIQAERPSEAEIKIPKRYFQDFGHHVGKDLTDPAKAADAVESAGKDGLLTGAGLLWSRIRKDPEKSKKKR